LEVDLEGGDADAGDCGSAITARDGHEAIVWKSLCSFVSVTTLAATLEELRGGISGMMEAPESGLSLFLALERVERMLIRPTRRDIILTSRDDLTSNKFARGGELTGRRSRGSSEKCLDDEVMHTGRKKPIPMECLKGAPPQRSAQAAASDVELGKIIHV